jgi:hypothetical protein
MNIEDLQHNYLAAWIYAQTAKLRNWNLATSPGWRIDPRGSKIMDLMQPGMVEVQRTVRQVSDRVWEAPSAWHAALYLNMMQHHILSQGARLLFRGHRCETWDLSPSILRPRVNLEREAQRAAVFAQLLASLSFNTGRIINPGFDLYLRISPSSYLAAAQHYGINTHLLDFTTDPDVAVWFATNDGDSDNGWACVHILPLNAESNSGHAIVLPPPFVRRLYIQRGMFVRADSALLAKEVMTLRFPWRPSVSEMKEFWVLRDGGAVVDLVPEETCLVPVRELADRVVNGELKIENQAEIEAIARSLKPQFRGVYSNLVQMWAEYVDAFEDALYAIAYDFTNDDKLVCDTSRLSAIVRSNVETCGSVAAFYRALPKLVGPDAGIPPEKLAWQAQLADTLDGIAARECGYHHQSAAASYADWLGVEFKRDDKRQ